MKKTEYFVKRIGYTQENAGLKDVVNQKNDFIKNNIDEIAKIESEDIKITAIAGNQVLFTIQLTYYPKK